MGGHQYGLQRSIRSATSRSRSLPVRRPAGSWSIIPAAVQARVQWAFSLCSLRAARSGPDATTPSVGGSIAHNEGSVDFSERAVPSEKRCAAAELQSHPAYIAICCHRPGCDREEKRHAELVRRDGRAGAAEVLFQRQTRPPACGGVAACTSGGRCSRVYSPRLRSRSTGPALLRSGKCSLRALSSTNYDLVYFDSVSLADYRHLVTSGARVLNHHNIESQLFERRIAYEQNPLKRFYLRLEARKLRRYEAECGRQVRLQPRGVGPRRGTAARVLCRCEHGSRGEWCRCRLFSAERRGVRGARTSHHGQRHELVSEPGCRAVHDREHLARPDEGDARRQIDNRRRASTTARNGPRRQGPTYHGHGIRRRHQALHGSCAGLSLPDAGRRWHTAEGPRRIVDGQADRGNDDGARGNRRRTGAGRTRWRHAGSVRQSDSATAAGPVRYGNVCPRTADPSWSRSSPGRSSAGSWRGPSATPWPAGVDTSRGGNRCHVSLQRTASPGSGRTSCC